MLAKLLPILRSALTGTLSLLATASLAQTTIHVGPGQPYTTIQSGIQAANAGDTVLVEPGTYGENINFSGKAITVVSAQGAAKTIIQGDGTMPVVTFVSAETRNSILNGFTIQGVSNPTPNQYYPGILVGSAPTIINNIITNNPCNGINVDFGGPLIQGNVISNTNESNNGRCDSFTGSAIVLGGNYPQPSLVIGNTIIHNQHAVDYDGGGLQIWAGENSVIEGNVFADNATTGDGGGIATFNSDNMIIAGNLFYGNVAQFGGGAIALHPPDETQGPFIGLIQNNTFIGNTSISSMDEYGEPAASQVYLDGNLAQYEFTDNIAVGADKNAVLVCGPIYNYLSATPLVFDHNDIYNPAGPGYGGACPDQTGQYGNISADPLFKKPASNDYHLLAGSPAIDTGNNSALQLLANLDSPLTGDLDGNPRVLDATGKGYPVIDMGVYESAGKLTANPTTAVLNPSAYYVNGGQSFTLTANMYSPLGIPTGTVSFFEDGNQIGAATIDGTGGALLTLGKGLVPGTHAFLATYAGEGVFPPCESVKIFVLVNAYGVTLNLTSAPNPSLVGQSVTFQTNISSVNGVPPGVITLTDNTTNTTLATLTSNASGNASFPISTLALGAHGIVASYQGNSTYSSASASVLQVVVSQIATATTLSSSLDPSPYGTAVTFTASVSSSGSGSPTGAITFLDGSAILATVSLVNGVAYYTTSSLSVGSHVITANYQPTGSLGSSTASLTEVINGFKTSTVFTCLPNPLNVGNTAQLIASVSSAGGTPTGSISFTDNGALLATRNLLSGTTSLSYIGSVAGTHNIVATYTPTGPFAVSSASCSEVVDALPTTSTLTVAPASSTYGSPVTLTATVSPATLPGPSTPTGIVTFLNGATVLGTGTLAGGVATLSSSGLPGGTYNLTCAYGGSSVYLTSTCNSFPVVIHAAATALTLGSSRNPSPFLNTITFTARLTVNNQSAGAGNTIHLSIHGQNISLTTDANGSATYTPGSLPPDSYPVTASFSGTNDLLGSTASLTEVVTAAATSTTLTGAPNPGNVNQVVTLTATVSAQGNSTQSNASPVGSGSVTFYDGDKPLGSSQLSATGTADLTTSFSVVGVHSITAVYGGDTDYFGSSSAVFQETIIAGDFSILATPGAASMYTGEAVSVQVSVTSLNGFNQPVALSCSGLPANATCAFSPASLPQGQGAAKLVIQTAAPHKASSASASGPAAVMGALTLLLLPAWRRRRSLLAGLSSLLLMMALGLGISGCGSVKPITGGTPPGTYQVAVTATATGDSTALTHSAVVTLTVKSLF